MFRCRVGGGVVAHLVVSACNRCFVQGHGLYSSVQSLPQSSVLGRLLGTVGPFSEVLLQAYDAKLKLNPFGASGRRRINCFSFFPQIFLSNCSIVNFSAADDQHSCVSLWMRGRMN